MALKLAVVASGTGTNFTNIVTHIEQGSLDAEVCLLASNNPSAKAIEKAHAKQIPVWVKDHKKASSREAFDRELGDALAGSKAEIIVLAGYMRLLSSAFISRFAGRIVNIHPALLPSFAGAHGGRDAAEYGVRFTGCTVHFVDEIMDNGPIIIQAAMPIFPGENEESFMPFIHKLEHVIYPQALQWIAEKRLTIKSRHVLLVPSQKANNPTVNNFERPCLISPYVEIV